MDFKDIHLEIMGFFIKGDIEEDIEVDIEVDITATIEDIINYFKGTIEDTINCFKEIMEDINFKAHYTIEHFVGNRLAQINYLQLANQDIKDFKHFKDYKDFKDSKDFKAKNQDIIADFVKCLDSYHQIYI
jgi:hypothetical protein